jgi:proteasome assembly chaperone (PAC2) family protein
MTAVAEYEASDLFDIDHVEVKDGIIQSPRRPRNRFFVWTDPNKKHDLVVFLGEAQPPIGKWPFCRQLVTFAKQLGVTRVFTFAAMATQMRLEAHPRVFAAATNEENLDELKRLELTVLEGGNIGGLNGVLLGAADEAGLPGACLLGEMPHVFAQFPFPKASLAILESFAVLTGIDLDTAEMARQAEAADRQLGELLARVERSMGQDEDDENDEDEEAEDEIGYQTDVAPEEKGVRPSDLERIEALFDRAEKDRSKAFELKAELDRLGIFKSYEDRFLDLFKKS